MLKVRQGTAQRTNGGRYDVASDPSLHSRSVLRPPALPRRLWRIGSRPHEPDSERSKIGLPQSPRLPSEASSCDDTASTGQPLEKAVLLRGVCGGTTPQEEPVLMTPCR